jgi:ABC-type sugar transport system permease subunit
MRESRIKDFFNLEAHEKRLAFFLILPTILIVFGVLIFPLIYSFFLSFTNATLTITGLEFAGFQNYIRAFKDEVALKAFLVSFKYVFMAVSLKLVLGLVAALLLNQNFVGRGLARSLIIIPWATPFVVSGVIWRWMYEPNVGVINVILKKIGIISTNVTWLSNVKLALPSIVITDVWQGSPFFIIIILAGLQTIPSELYEAAVVDGAGKLIQFIRITLPMIRFPIFIVTILGTMFSMNQFDLFYVMTRGGPGSLTRVITLYNWQIAFRFFNISYAAAVSYLILFITFLITIVYFSILRKSEE